MISLLLIMLPGHGINSIWVNQNTEGTSIDDEPRDESAELGGCEEVYFEHGDGVRSYWFFPEAVDAEFRDLGVLGESWGGEIGMENEHSRRMRSHSSGDMLVMEIGFGTVKCQTKGKNLHPQRGLFLEEQGFLFGSKVPTSCKLQLLRILLKIIDVYVAIHHKLA